MSYASSDAVVSTEWLAEHLSAPDIRVVDASWNHPSLGRNARAEYDSEHVPGAVFFDIDDVSDKSTSLPHMLPDAAKFASKVRKLGLGNGNRVIVYDRSSGGAAAARVWWMFRLFGHTEVSVLDGGLEKWLKEGRPTEDLPPMPRERHFMPRVNQLLARDLEQMKTIVAQAREQIVDARPPGRFAGTDADPWPSKKSGHMPGAKNLPWTALLDPESKTLLPAEQLAERFRAAGIDVRQPVVASCGSGVTACMLALGLYVVGNDEAAVYDGSWAEWGLAEDTPVAAE
ncbi:MAG TPA: 3-mercaptopyruvate sulfurtransferase [Candidatus Sulfotelmatobacter sp.]|jgi:thiosulfate/3-mercaptopyruvate sulfurtransferase|nr:3-mercaptopyruvate sulfurtransferase [Candidatus Sulfotelmatobacter sp.]